MCITPENELTCCQRNGFKDGCDQGQHCPENRLAFLHRVSQIDEAMTPFGTRPAKFIDYVPCSMFFYERLSCIKWFGVLRLAVLCIGLMASVPVAMFLAKLLWAWIESTEFRLP